MTNENTQVNRDFKGIWIPREIWLAEGLSATEKILWAEIDSLYDEEKKGCYASNEYLARFMGVKERTLRDALCKLRQLKLIEDVSFDGRERVIKALPVGADFSVRLAEWRKSAMLDGENPPPYVAKSRHPHVYIDTSVDQSIDSSLKVPEDSADKSAVPAKAGEDELKKSSHKKIKATADFSPEVHEICKLILNALQRTNPEFVPPKNYTPWLTTIDFMLRLDKRDGNKLMDVFNWALADSFWCDKMFKPNPVKYLRERYNEFVMKMNAKPPAKERKFAPSSKGKFEESELYKEWNNSAI